MRAHENERDHNRFTRESRPRASRWLVALLAGSAIAGAITPRIATAEVALVVVDVVAVADGYRFSKLKGTKIINPQKEEIGELDDLIVGKDRVLFAIIEVGGFLGIGGKLVAVPYTALQISDGGRRIVLPGATKEGLRALPEFKYR
jgi:PRC-barrel domain protein